SLDRWEEARRPSIRDNRSRPAQPTRRKTRPGLPVAWRRQTRTKFQRSLARSSPCKKHHGPAPQSTSKPWPHPDSSIALPVAELCLQEERRGGLLLSSASWLRLLPTHRE